MGLIDWFSGTSAGHTTKQNLADATGAVGMEGTARNLRDETTDIFGNPTNAALDYTGQNPTAALNPRSQLAQGDTTGVNMMNQSGTSQTQQPQQPQQPMVSGDASGSGGASPEEIAHDQVIGVVHNALNRIPQQHTDRLFCLVSLVLNCIFIIPTSGLVSISIDILHLNLEIVI